MTDKAQQSATEQQPPKTTVIRIVLPRKPKKEKPA